MTVAIIKIYHWLWVPLLFAAPFFCSKPARSNNAPIISNVKTMEKPAASTNLNISSTAFAAGSMIPTKYTCDGANINPPLGIQGIPENTKCLALIVDDPDAPAGTWVHWVVWNIPVTEFIEENTVPGKGGLNDFNRILPTLVNKHLSCLAA